MAKPMIRVSLVSVAVMASFSACTRNAKESPMFDAAKIVVTANLSDTKLPLDAGKKPVAVHPSVAINGEAYSTARYFRLVDDLRALGAESSDDSITSLAAALYKGFYADAGNFTRTTFLRSPIPAAAEGQGAGPIRDAVASMDGDLHSAQKSLDNLLAQSVHRYRWPRSLPRFADGVSATDGYANWLLDSVKGLPISGPLKAAAVQELQKEYAKYRLSLVSLAQGLDNARHLGDALRSLETGLRALNVTLNPADAATLRKADALAAQLSSMQSAQDALAILITVWRLTPPADRVATFQKVSPQLADFLKDKSDADLDCLAHPACVNPLVGIPKLVIFQKLEDYGLTKLRDQVDASARDSLLATAREQALKSLPTLPLVVRDAIDQQLLPYYAVIRKVKTDVAGFVRDHLESWASAHFSQPLKALETSSVTVSLRSRDQLAVKATAPATDVVTTGADTLGASLALSDAFLPDAAQLPALQGAVMEPIMKILAIGGFQQPNGKPFPGFLLPIDGPLTKVFELGNLMKEPVTYAVPDSFQANALFQMDRKHARKNVSAGAQAELLKGISRQIGFYRDWEQNTYDVSLGRIHMEDLAPEIPAGAIQGSFLPKDVLFAMTLANAGAVLENLILNLSPAFLVLEDGSLLWGNHYQEIKGNKVSTVAGMVSIADGQRDGIVRTADVARYVLALDEFMAATEGMENTGSSLLQQKTKDGQSTLLADLLDIRKKLQLLQMGLTNYLVYTAQQPNGSLATSFRATDHLEPTGAPRRLEDQTLAIRALLASAKRLDLPLFRWAALDVYFGMNKNFFDASRQFYAGELGADGKPGRPAATDEIVQALLAGHELEDFMPSDTREQWQQLARPYVRAVEDL